MKKILFVFLLAFVSTLAQGKLYTKENADELYGPVVDSVKINTAMLVSLMDSTDSHIMFRVEDSKVNILGDQRKLIMSGISANIDEKDVYHLASKATTLELLNKGGEDITYIEMRECNHILTVSNGNFTMESMWPCPPYCGE